jgi:hypothetical protein
MNKDLFFKGDGLLKFFSNWKKNWKLYKYAKFLKKDIYSLYRTSYKSDREVYKIISMGVSHMTVQAHTIHGVLSNGEKFCVWNSNFWYSWASCGQVGDLYWDARGSSMKGIMHYLCSYYPQNEISSGPTIKCLSDLRSYFLSIDPLIFYDHFEKKIDILNYRKSYDLTQFNRDQKLQKILNG